MNKSHLISLVWLTAVFLLTHPHAVADNSEPCFIFSGNASEVKILPLKAYNHIGFDQNGLIVSSSTDKGVSEESIPYKDYNRFYVGMANPTLSTVITEAQREEEIQLLFDSKAKLLTLISQGNEPHVVNIYNMAGNIMLFLEIRSEGRISVHHLIPGIYIATTVGRNNHTLKFIIK